MIKKGKNATFPLILLSIVLFSGSLSAQTAREVLRKPIGKGACELVYSQGEDALYLATSQSRKLDKGGVVYRLNPATLDVTQIIHNDINQSGASINNKTNMLFFSNRVNSAITAIDTKTGKVMRRLVLDSRKGSETVKPLAPCELVVDADTDTLYITGVGGSSVVWVVNGEDLTLRTTITHTGKLGTGLALDSAANRLFVTNADGELVTIDTKSNKVLSRKKLDASKEHFFLNISLDIATHRAFITDSKQPQVLVVDTRNGNILGKIDVPESLAVLFNPVRNEVYVTPRQAGEVSVIDAQSHHLLNTIKTPTHPNSLALSADGQTLYISIKQAASREKEASAPDDVMRIALK